MPPTPRLLQALLDKLPARRPAPRPLVDRDHLPSVYLPAPPAPREPAIPEPTWEPWLIDQQSDDPATDPATGDRPDDRSADATNACFLDGAPYDGDGILGRYCSWACADADEPISLLGDTPTR
ncbi:hypothetical protein [Kitasatospora sp. NPDC001132]